MLACALSQQKRARGLESNNLAKGKETVWPMSSRRPSRQHSQRENKIAFACRPAPAQAPLALAAPAPAYASASSTINLYCRGLDQHAPMAELFAARTAFLRTCATLNFIAKVLLCSRHSRNCEATRCCMSYMLHVGVTSSSVKLHI